VVGVLLVLTSVVLMSRIVAAADRSTQVWALTRDVAAGTTLAAADLRPARVRLFASAPAYLQVDSSPAGRTVSRALHEGELLPAAALGGHPPGVIVSIPVKPENAPAVVHGQLVDVWSTAKGCPPVRVLGSVAVQEVRSGGGGALAVSTGAVQVIVRVRAEQAERVVAALGAETTVRLVVLDGVPPAGGGDTGVADGCLASGPPNGFRRVGQAARVGSAGPAAAGPPRRARWPGGSSSGGAVAGGSGAAGQPTSDARPAGRAGRPRAEAAAGGRR
jgi:hypothetical protein